MERKTNLVINWPGGIERLALHTGAAKAWYELGLPAPDEILASSAGGFAASAIMGWSAEELDRAVKVIGDLSPKKIFSYRRGLKIKLSALGVATIGIGALVLLDHKLSKGKKAMLGLAALGALLATDALVGNELIHSEAHLSPGPLRKLLNGNESGLNFEAIFNSPIRLGIVVADASQPRGVVFYNHDPLKSDPDNPAHIKRWIDILLASSRLPGKFPFIRIDGIDTIDGEVWTDFPIRQMKGSKKIVRFDYWPPLQSKPAPKEWLSDVHRSFEIMRDRITQEEMDKYESERKADPTLPEVYYVRLSPELASVTPHIHLHNFTPAQMKELQNIGYATVMEQKDELRKYLNS